MAHVTRHILIEVLFVLGTIHYLLLEKLSEHSFRAKNVAKDKLIKNPIHIDRMKLVKIPKDMEGKGENVDPTPTKEEEKIVATEQPVPAAPGGPTVPKNPTEDNAENRTTRNDEEGQMYDDGQSPSLATNSIKVDQGWGITNNVYNVERLVKVRGSTGNREYLLRWAPINGARSRDSWVKAEDITPSAINAFYDRHTMAGKVRKVFQGSGRRLPRN